MRELNNIEQAIHRTQLEVAFEGIAIDALTPLIRASDAGEIELPHEVWTVVLQSVTQKVAEAYFGTSNRLPEDS